MFAFGKYDPCSVFHTSQKIDRIKQQLTDLANLVSSGHTVEDDEDEGPLADDELETLRAAGVIASPTEQKGKHTPVSPRHIVFVEDAAEGEPTRRLPLWVLTIFSVQQHLEKSTSVDKTANSVTPASGSDLGWKTQNSTQSKRRRRKKQSIVDESPEEGEQGPVNVVRDCISVPLLQRRLTSAQKHRKHLLKELAARLVRDTQLSYALRELEMQRLLAGKGGRKKVRGAELVEEDKDDFEDEDDDQHKQKSVPSVYKPRVYKWRVERKR